MGQFPGKIVKRGFTALSSSPVSIPVEAKSEIRVGLGDDFDEYTFCHRYVQFHQESTADSNVGFSA